MPTDDFIIDQYSSWFLSLSLQRLLADRGYIGQAVVNLMVTNVAEAVPPPHQHAKRARENDRWRDGERRLAERFINKK